VETVIESSRASFKDLGLLDRLSGIASTVIHGQVALPSIPWVVDLLI